MKGKRVMRRTLIALSLAGLIAPAQADDREELEALRQTTMKLVELMVQSGILTKDKAEDMLRDARRAAQANVNAAPAGGASGGGQRVVRVPYVPETVRNQIKDELRQEVMAKAEQERWAAPGLVPDWVSRIKFSGDIRVRQQYVYQDPNNTAFLPDPNDTSASGFLNTTDDYTQTRLRLRLAAEAKLSEEFSAGLRLTTGSTSNPVSTNQTMGQSGNRYSVTVDQAYIKYQPFPWPSMPSLGIGPMQAQVVAGRFANPWLSTDLVWDEDLSFEGIAATLRPRLGDYTTGFATVGAFPIQDLGCSVGGCSKDKTLYGGQLGFDFQRLDQQRLRAGVAFYSLRGITPETDGFDSGIGTDTAPLGYRQKGNTSLQVFDLNGSSYRQEAPLSDFKLLNLTASYEYRLADPYWLTFTGDWVKNLGYDSAEVNQRLGADQEERSMGYHLGVQFGYPAPSEAGEWSVGMAYKYLQRDAVLDSFTDSDFHLGGTDAKGWILSGTYGLARNTTFRARWLSANEIDGPPLAIDLLQLDLNARF